MRTIKKEYRVDKSRIGFMKFIFEAYDGIAVVTTLSSTEGRVRIAIAPGCEDDVDTVLGELKKGFLLHEI